MHFSTSAIYVILLSFLGGSKTAHADQYEDAFGVTNYAIQCQNRLYPKYFIYAAAKNLCDIERKMPGFSDRDPKALGFKNKFFYHFRSENDNQKLLKASNLIVPILEDGKLYPLESVFRKNSAGEMDKRDPGPDRLVVDIKCNIVGAFTDFDYSNDGIENRIEECRVLKSSSDSFVPWGRSSERSQRGSLSRSRDQSPQRSQQGSPPRSRDQSPQRSQQGSPPRSRDRSPERFQQRSPPRSRDRSPERLPVSASVRTIDQSAEKIPELSG